LACSARAQAEDVHAPSHDEFRGDARAHAARMGRLLQCGFHLEAIALHVVDTGEAGVHIRFQALPADVREHGHSNRQRPAKPGHSVGSLACETLPSALHRETNARIAGLRGPLFNHRDIGRLTVRNGAIRPSEPGCPFQPRLWLGRRSPGIARLPGTAIAFAGATRIESLRPRRFPWNTKRPPGCGLSTS
jgi:hypothetical protein